MEWSSHFRLHIIQPVPTVAFHRGGHMNHCVDTLYSFDDLTIVYLARPWCRGGSELPLRYIRIECTEPPARWQQDKVKRRQDSNWGPGVTDSISTMSSTACDDTSTHRNESAPLLLASRYHAQPLLIRILSARRTELPPIPQQHIRDLLRRGNDHPVHTSEHHSDMPAQSSDKAINQSRALRMKWSTATFL